VRTWLRYLPFPLHRAVVLAWLALALLLGRAACAQSIVEAAEFHSAVLGRNWTYNVYLPDGYHARAADLYYPVMYLLHGNNGQRNDWPVYGGLQRTVDRLIRSGAMPPAIIVMPDAGTSWYVDLKEPMETAFFQELLPHVENTYRALASRDARVIGGLSMGGYGALRYVLKYPERFQAAALLSPAIYTPEPPPDSSARSVGVFTEARGQYSAAVWQAHNYPALWDAFLARQMPVPMYVNSGDDDLMIEAEATRLYSLLRSNRQPAELRIVNGKHEWPVWESTLGEALQYVFRTVRRPQAQE